MTLRTKTIAVALTLVLLVTGLTLFNRSDPPAAAAVTGAGYSAITPYGGYLGNYIAPDGTRVYCMDSGRDWPSGATDGGSVVGSIDSQWGEALSGTVIRKLNYALLTWGQTDDPTTAAAVSAYVYAYTSNYAREHGAGHDVGSHFINGNAAVQAAYETVWNESETAYAGRGDARASITIDMANTYDGSVRVTTSPSDATGRLSLTGAVVAGTDETSIEVRDGSVVPIRGIASSDALSYEVEASGAFTAPMGAEQELVVYSTGSQQRTIRGTGPATAAFSAEHSTEIPLRFAPVVRTQVASRFVESGDALIDGVLVSIEAGSPSWRGIDGVPASVVANGTLYGPFTEQPDVSAEPPANAPVVGRERVTLTGPGDYASAGSLLAPTAGFYTWVWSIDSASQAPEVTALLADGYRFSDQFGLVAESHVVQMAVSAVTRASTAEVGLGGEIGDSLSVSLEKGAWLTVDGEPIVAQFEGTAYFVPGDTPPGASAEVPADATPIGSATVSVSTPGIYEAPLIVTAPSATAGYVTWVWALSTTSAYAAYFEPWSDRFGLPAETTRVAPPTVATVAVSGVTIDDEVHDTAMVGGVLPVRAPHLVFRAYLQGSGQPATCDESTLVFDSSDSPVTVTALGNYDSPTTRFSEYGTYFWVESLYSHEGELIHAGECGAPGETTLVSPVEVVTQAVRSAAPGDEVHDTARVSGPVPRGAMLVFEAFAQHGIVDGPLCDASTLIYTSDPVAVTAAGLYDSPATRLQTSGTYYWVETLVDRNGEPLHVGECGVENETTQVAHASLASTGVPVVRTGLAGLALIFGGIVVVGARILSKRREYR